MTFRPRPTPRPSAADLASALAPAARPLPATTGRVTEAATAQVNIRCTPTLARIIAEAARREGSARRLIARALAAYGLDVPDADTNPPAGRLGA